jgi:hypothetical protein
MSAMRTLAPCWTKSLAVQAPMPLAPPVINATLPSSLQLIMLLVLEIDL